MNLERLRKRSTTENLSAYIPGKAPRNTICSFLSGLLMRNRGKSKVTLLSALNRIVLATVFTLSFLGYMAPELTLTLQLIPLALFAVLAFCTVSFSDRLILAVGSLLELDGILLIVCIPLLTLEQSIESSFQKSLPYWGVFAAYLLISRLYTAVVPVREIFESFFWSAIVCLSIFLLGSYATLLDSATTLARFEPYNFHPNLIAWIMAGYLCAMVWKIMTGSWSMKLLAGFGSVICLTNIFFASSRGAIVGIIVGCGVIGGMAVFRGVRERRNKFLWIGLPAGALLLASAMMIAEREQVEDAFSFVDRVLALSTPERGLDSGFTGRWATWEAVVHTLRDGTFLLGHGMRASDAMETMIDNSYLVIVYDMGLLPLILILFRFLHILLTSFQGYFRAPGDQERGLRLTCTLLVVMILVTNIVERSLFAVGNPFSLLVFLLFATPTWQTRNLGFHSGNDPSLPRRIVARSLADFQPSV